jgi:hypothetical protein
LKNFRQFRTLDELNGEINFRQFRTLDELIVEQSLY